MDYHKRGGICTQGKKRFAVGQVVSLTQMPRTCTIRNLQEHEEEHASHHITSLDNAAGDQNQMEMFGTWVPLDEGSGAAEVAGDVGVAVLLVEGVEGVGGVGKERVRLVAPPARLQLGAVGAAGAARPVQRVLEVLLGGAWPGHAPRHAVDERHVALRWRLCRDRRHRLCLFLWRDASGGCRG